MNMKILLRLVLGLVFAFSASHSLAQSNPLYVPLGGAVKGALYKPDSGAAPHVGILVTHRTSNVLSSLPCTELSRRGSGPLHEPALRQQRGVGEMGDHSSRCQVGGQFPQATTGNHQSAPLGWQRRRTYDEFLSSGRGNGPSYCQGPNKLIECENNLAGLPPADGIIFRDAHPGNPANGVRSINPAIGNGLGRSG